MFSPNDRSPLRAFEASTRGGLAASETGVVVGPAGVGKSQLLIHLALATFRSIETRRAMVRSTNTGISAFVDPVGRLAKRSGQWTQETIVGDVPLIQDRGETVYMVVGDVLGWASLLMIGLGLLRKKRTL